MFGMRTRFAAMLVVGVAAAPTAARAERPANRTEYSETVEGYLTARSVVIPDGPDSSSPPSSVEAVIASRYIYLNKGGISVLPGNNNSAQNRSTIVNAARTVPAWNINAANWGQVVSCMQELFAPFNVAVSDQPPATNVRHIEAVFGGVAQDVDPTAPANVLGVSPFTPACGVIEDSIVFVFAQAAANALGNDYRKICEIGAQEVAHSVGLDHVMNASDPMTYLPFTGNRSFKSGAVSCGENQARPCGLVSLGYPSCRPDQDSVALLRDRLGPAGGGGLPTVAIQSPTNSAVVSRGFTVLATASDDVAVTRVELYIDGDLAGTDTSAPYQFRAPQTLADGAHELAVVAYDASGESESRIQVTLDADAPGGSPVDIDPDAPQMITGGCSTQENGQAPLGIALFLLSVALMRRRSTC